MTQFFFVKFGPISVQIEFDAPLSRIAEIIRKWLEAGLASSASQPDIIFSITSTLCASSKPREKLFAGNGWLDNNHFGCWDERGWENRIIRQATGSNRTTLRWECTPKNNTILAIAKQIPSTLIKLAHQHYFSYPEMLASTFLYRQLIPALQVILMENNSSLIHSSALKHSSGLGVLVSGWGGSGKTSASSYLYLNNPDEWQYMSDDLAILDANGGIHYSPIPLNIFPYNTQQFLKLEDAVVGKMQKLEKIHWRTRKRLFGSNSVARRTAPLNEGSKPSPARLGLAIHLQRFSGKAPQINKINASELAIVAKNILSYELRHGLPTYLLANAFSTEKPPILPSPDEIAESTKNILSSAMSKAQTFSINIPKDYGPEEVSSVVEQLAKKINTLNR